MKASATPSVVFTATPSSPKKAKMPNTADVAPGWWSISITNDTPALPMNTAVPASVTFSYSAWPLPVALVNDPTVRSALMLLRATQGSTVSAAMEPLASSTTPGRLALRSQCQMTSTQIMAGLGVTPACEMCSLPL